MGTYMYGLEVARELEADEFVASLDGLEPEVQSFLSDLREFVASAEPPSEPFKTVSHVRLPEPPLLPPRHEGETTITYAQGGDFYEGAILSRCDGWNFHRIASVGSATCMTVEDLPFWLLWRCRLPLILSIAQKCLLAIIFGGFVGFIGALV